MALFAAVITITFRMGSLPLINPDEGRNAEVAREMKERGAWLVPTYDGVNYLDKPALYFKAVAVSLAVFGDNELAARIPSAVFGFAILALVWMFCLRECGPRVAALAVLVIATTPLFVSQARTVIFDIALALFVSLSIFAGYWAETYSGRKRTMAYLMAAAASGVATLVKGPVGLIVPLLVLLTFHAVERRSGAWKRLLSPVHALVYLALVLPWFLGLVWTHPDFLHYGLVEETLNRFATGQFHRTAPPYYFLWVLPVTFFPWSLLLSAGLLVARHWRDLPRVSRLSVVWSLSVVVFFSVSQSKLPGYILSVSIPFGILVAQLFDAALRNPAGAAARHVRFAAGSLAFLMLLTAGAVLVASPAMGILSHSVHIPRSDFTIWDFSPSMLPLAVMLLALTALGAWGWFRRRPTPIVLVFGLLPVSLVILGAGVFLTVYESRSGRAVAVRMGPIAPTTELVFYRCFPAGLPFYLGRTAQLVTRDGSELSSNYAVYALRNSAVWPEGVIRPEGFDRWLQESRKSVYLIVNESERHWLEILAQSHGSTVNTLSRRYSGALLPPGARFPHEAERRDVPVL